MFTVDYLLMTILRILLFAVTSTSAYMAISRLNESNEDQDDVSLKNFVYIIGGICAVIEVTCYLNYKQSAELFLRAKKSEQQQQMLQCMFDALPGSVLICTKGKPEEVKSSQINAQASDDKAKIRKPLFVNKKMTKFFSMATLQEERGQSNKRMSKYKVMTSKIFVNRSQLEVAS